MTRTLPTAVIAQRFCTLADTLTRNAQVLLAAGLPDAVAVPRATVYQDVAEQVRQLAAAEVELAEGSALVLPLTPVSVAHEVARRFERLAGVLARNARTITASGEAGLLRRAGVYRDVAVQARLLAEDEVAQSRQITRPAVPAAMVAPSPVVAHAAARVPSVRPAFLESLVAAIAKRRARGWSVARLTLWLRTTLRDPQMDTVHPCAARPFVSYVTSLLSGAQSLRAA